MAFTVTVRFNIIPKVITTITDESADAVRDSAHYSRDYATAIAPIRTGALRDSFYVHGPNNESDYAERAAAAENANPRANIVREVRDATEGTDTRKPKAIVASAVEYALYLEEGTVHMAPRPTLIQASLVGAERFRHLMAHIADVV